MLENNVGVFYLQRFGKYPYPNQITHPPPLPPSLQKSIGWPLNIPFATFIKPCANGCNTVGRQLPTFRLYVAKSLTGFKLSATTCNRVYKRTQHVTSNKVGSCWPTMLRPFARGFRGRGRVCMTRNFPYPFWSRLASLTISSSWQPDKVGIIVMKRFERKRIHLLMTFLLSRHKMTKC